MLTTTPARLALFLCAYLVLALLPACGTGSWNLGRALSRSEPPPPPPAPPPMGVLKIVNHSVCSFTTVTVQVHETSAPVTRHRDPTPVGPANSVSFPIGAGEYFEIRAGGPDLRCHRVWRGVTIRNGEMLTLTIDRF